MAKFGELISRDTYANRPAAGGGDGELFFPSDGFVIERDNGSIWNPYGPIFPLVPPVSNDFSWVNQGGATLNTTGGGVYIYAPKVSGANLRIRIKTAPTPPYTVTAALLSHLMRVDYQGCGILWRESSSGKLVGPFLDRDFSIQLSKMNSPTSFNAAYSTQNLARHAAPITFLKLEDDNTNRKIHWSRDGQNWLQLHSVSRTDFCTADEIGFFANASNSLWPCGVTLLHWKEE